MKDSDRLKEHLTIVEQAESGDTSAMLELAADYMSEEEGTVGFDLETCG